MSMFKPYPNTEYLYFFTYKSESYGHWMFDHIQILQYKSLFKYFHRNYCMYMWWIWGNTINITVDYRQFDFCTCSGVTGKELKSFMYLSVTLARWLTFCCFSCLYVLINKNKYICIYIYNCFIYFMREKLKGRELAACIRLTMFVAG